MQLCELTIQAFGPFVEKIEVNFKPYEKEGLFLICGATGSGKTTLLDAITYALYGMTADGLRSGKAVRSHQAPMEIQTQITLTFNWGGDSYSLWRQAELERPKKRGDGYTKQPPKAKLWKNNTLIETHWSRVTDYIKDLLSLGFHQFRQTVILPQGEFRQLLLAEGRQRQLLLETLFQTERYQKLEDYLKELYRKNLNQLDAIKEKEKWLFEKGGVASFLDLKIRKSEYDVVRKKIKIEETFLRNKKQHLWKKYQKNYHAYQQWLHYSTLIEKKKTLDHSKMVIKEKKQRIKEALNVSVIDPLLIRKETIQKQWQIVESKILTIPLEIKCPDEDALFLIQSRIHKKKEALTFQKQWELVDKQITRKNKEYINLEEELKGAQHHQLVLLSTYLKKGNPCPLCGSKEHPDPIKTEKQGFKRKELEELQSKVEAVRQELNVLEQKKSKIPFSNLSVHGLEEDERYFKEQKSQLEKAITLKNQKEHLSKEKIILEKDEKKIETEIKKQTLQLGYSSLKELLKFRVPRYLLDKEQKEVTTYETTVSLIEKELLECQVRDLVEKPEESSIKEVDAEIERVIHQLSMIEKQYSEDLKIFEELTLLIIEKKDKEERYTLLGTLAEAAIGKNSKKISLHRYILSVLFEDVLFHATRHLEGMTLKRYSLHHTEGDARFELSVFDHHIGKSRPVSTLSGGESFLASLSLALGLSDTIQHYSGGKRLETFFIDEGFGSLDPQALDQVLQTLERLSKQGRTIGIISHLEEIKERIHSQMEIGRASLVNREAL